MSDAEKETKAIAERLLGLANHLSGDSRKDSLKSGLTAERLSILAILAGSGPQTINKLAEMEQVSAPAITRTVKSLEKQGYVIKSRSKTDQRVVYVAPTRKSQQLLDEARREKQAAIENLLQGVSSSDLQVLQKAMAILVKQIITNMK